MAISYGSAELVRADDLLPKPWRWQLESRLPLTIPFDRSTKLHHLQSAAIELVEHGSRSIRRMLAAYDEEARSFVVDESCKTTQLCNLAEGMSPIHQRLSDGGLKLATAMAQEFPAHEDAIRIQFGTAAVYWAKQTEAGQKDVERLETAWGPIVDFDRPTEATIAGYAAMRWLDRPGYREMLAEGSVCCGGGASIEYLNLQSQNGEIRIDYDSCNGIMQGEWFLRQSSGNCPDRAMQNVSDDLQAGGWQPAENKILYLISSGFQRVLRTSGLPAESRHGAAILPWKEPVINRMIEVRNGVTFDHNHLTENQKTSIQFDAATLLGIGAVARPQTVVFCPPKQCRLATGVLVDLRIG